MIDGERRLRPKTKGQAIMVSSIIDESRGFGYPVTDEEWQKLKPIYDKFHGQYKWFHVPEPLDGHQRQIGTVYYKFGARSQQHDSSANDPLNTGWWYII